MVLLQWMSPLQDKRNHKGTENLRPYKKGQSGNPEGGRKHNPIMRRLKALTNEQVAEIGTLILEGNLPQLQAIAKDDTAPALKVLIASVVAKAMQRGDAHALNIILDRIAGKIKERIELTGDPQKPIGLTVVSNEELKQRLAQIESDV
jgi:Family of unknown function (DUF5681)